MPYIRKENQGTVTTSFDMVNSGDLNYAIHQLMDKYIDRCGGISYGVINDLVGALECVKQEFYRRLAVPYENNKIAINGDVAPYTHYDGDLICV